MLSENTRYCDEEKQYRKMEKSYLKGEKNSKQNYNKDVTREILKLT